MAATETATKDVLHSVKTSQVSRPHLMSSLSALGIMYETSMTDPVLIGLLAEKFRKLPKLAKCDVCGGMSDPSMDWCPFCGTSEDGTIYSLASKDKKEEKSAEAAQKGAKEMSTEKTEEKKKGKKGENGLAKTNGAALAKTSEKDLDKAVESVKRIMSDGAANYWQLGKELADIHARQLWKNRTDGDKVKYKSFDQFCASELNMSAMNAYRAIDVAKEYDEETARDLGMSKLALVLQAPKGARAELEDQLKKGATAKQLREKVKEARAKEGNKRRETGRSTKTAKATESAAKSRKVKAAKTGKVTVAFVDAVKTVRLYCKGSDEKPAKRLADIPWGKMELTNDVELHLSVVETSAGELVAKLKMKRVDAE